MPFARASQALKMTTVIPKLQEIIAGPMKEAGFPPPPMGEDRLESPRQGHSPARLAQHSALFRSQA